jgi:muconate cycloisomerase
MARTSIAYFGQPVEGIERLAEVARAIDAPVARAAGIPCNVNGSVETGIGNRANIALAAAAPAATPSCVVPVSTPAEALAGQVAGIYYRDDLIAAPMRFTDGAIEVPDLPGLGIAIDEAKVAKYLMRLAES